MSVIDFNPINNSNLDKVKKIKLMMPSSFSLECFCETPTLFMALSRIVTLGKGPDDIYIFGTYYFHEETETYSSILDFIYGPVIKLEEGIYKYYNNGCLGILNFKTGYKVELEAKIKEIFSLRNLEVTNISLNAIEGKDNLYDLVIKIGNVEELHIDISFKSETDNYCCNNSFYSTLYDGHFMAIPSKPEDDFINGEEFFDKLVKGPILNILFSHTINHTYEKDLLACSNVLELKNR